MDRSTMEGDHQGSRDSREQQLPREMLHEILLKLPAMDAARYCCVSRLWRTIVKDPSFPSLHHRNHASPSPAHHILLVSNKLNDSGSRVDATVFNVSTAKPMCCLTNHPSAGYAVANVCHGFLCFAPLDDGDSPVLVCNPVSGEKLELPKAPSVDGTSRESLWRHVFALGFSPSTMEYKLFRLSVPRSSVYVFPYRAPPPAPTSGNYVDVYTLGDAGGWRPHPYLFPNRPIHGSPPVLVDGRLYVVTSRPNQRHRPDRILVIDVATEEHCTYRLPDHDDPLAAVRVNAFEMHGRLCLAVNTIDWRRPMLQFWAMSPLGTRLGDTNDELYWDLLYSFHVDANILDDQSLYDRFRDLPRGAWLDGDEMLCYRVGDVLYKYNTRGYSPLLHLGFLPWSQQLQLVATPSTTWGVHAGYRPTLLSPLTFASPPSSDGQFEHALLSQLRCHPKSKRRAPPPVGRTDERAPKRMR